VPVYATWNPLTEADDMGLVGDFPRPLTARFPPISADTLPSTLSECVVSYSLSKGSFWREELRKGQDEAVQLEVWIRARQDIDVAYCPAHLCLDMARAHNIPDSSVEYLRYAFSSDCLSKSPWLHVYLNRHSYTTHLADLRDSSIQTHRVYLGHLDLFTSLPRRGLGAQDGIGGGGSSWRRERGDKRDKSAPQQEGEESSEGRRMGGAGEEAGEVARWCMAAVGGGLLVRERERERPLGTPPT
jgi:hypothetical protein